MRILLDTHAWVWGLLEPHRLGPSMKRILADATTERWLSPVSVWEAHLLAERGRIHPGVPADAWIQTCLRASSMREAALTFEIARRSRTVSLPHADPADRFIVATAEVLGLTLATADGDILRAWPSAVDCRL